MFWFTSRKIISYSWDSLLKRHYDVDVVGAVVVVSGGSSDGGGTLSTLGT